MATAAADVPGDDTATRSMRRYTLVAIALHWVIAALILANLFIGLRLDGVKGVAKFNAFQLHKSIGITVLVLSLARLTWRLLNPPPPYPASIKRWERLSASAVHHSFYALMIGMPLTGWIIVSASPLNIPTVLFKTISLPHIGPIHDLAIGTRHIVEDAFATTHTVLAWTFGLLILLHIGAALKHQFLQHDNVLMRMLPGRATIEQQETVAP